MLYSSDCQNITIELKVSVRKRVFKAKQTYIFRMKTEGSKDEKSVFEAD